MASIVVLSDTHSYFHKGIGKYIATADEVWHAGDIGSMEVYTKLKKESKKIYAVYGNIDGQEIRQHCPEYIYFTSAGVSVLMLHIAGYPTKYNSRAQQLIQQYSPNVVVCGHSHILKIMPDNMLHHLHINPGACGIYGWHKKKTLVLLDIVEQKIQNVKIVELEDV